jgi:ABC-type transport system involved in multi-copper enzyme maturation permease subunit
MFSHFFSFELRYFLRGWMVWIFLLVIGVMIFGAVSSDNVTVGGGLGNTHRNSPWVIQNFYGVASVLTLLMTTAFVNNAAIRDFQHNTHQMIFSLPVSKNGYLWGRFLGSSLIAILPSLGVSLGVLVGRFAPWADTDRFGPIYWGAHLNSLITLAIPNTIFIAAILFGIAALFRSTTISFLSALILLVLFGVTDSFASDLKNETLAAMLDPFGSRAFELMTKYWTVAEKNTLSVPLSGLLLWNRLIWLTAGLAIFSLITTRIRLGEEPSKKRKPAEAEDAAPHREAIALPSTKASWSGNASLAQFLGAFRFELKGLVKTPVFIVILAAAMLNCCVSLAMSTGEAFGNKTFPVTYQMAQIIQGTLYMFLIAIITFFAGQLVWRDRDERMDEIQDSLPMRDWLLYTSKFSALVLSLFAILSTTIAVGMAVQAYRGYTRFQFGLYAEEILFRDFSLMVMLAVAAFLCHVLSPNKYIGYFSFIAFLIVDAFGWNALDVATRMVNFASRPSIPYSDLYHFQPDSPGWQWFTVYWVLFCLLLATLSITFYRRGKETSWARRLRVAGQRFHGGLRLATFFFLACFAATAGWVFYNTKIVNEVVSSDEMKRRSANYERKYKQYHQQAQPRVTAVSYEIDIYPETRGIQMRGKEKLVNLSGKPVSEIHFTIDGEHSTRINIPGATLATDDKPLRYRIYRLSQPMQPDEAREISFTVEGQQKGFSNSVNRREFVQNGTFFNNGIAPQIGYDPGRELTDRNDRRKYGLPEKDLMPALERNCVAHCRNTYLSDSSDWVPVETVISTSADQIAIAPGSLQREWKANGRNYYHYKFDKDSMNFYSFISARYQVAREKWNGIDIEVYYHPEHSWNVPRMVQSVKKSLDYYTRNFGPYYHKQARIIEFPRVASFAQAFPGTMPYSESIGFIADLRDPENIDHVFYIVAHEMGHQWWAHQVIGANMQGATSLSETLAQYSALMVMEKEYGRDQMRKFLEYERDRYLRSRGSERLKERPLLQVEASQGYIHYQKGSIVMYYLKEMIGEDKVNAALRQLVEKFAYAPPPYPTSYELVDRLKAQTPPEYQYLIRDLFEEITLFSNRTLEAKARKLPDGRYEVTLKAEAKKLKANDQGVEKEVPVQDWIEIGAFAKPANGKKYGKTLYRQRLFIDKPSITKTFLVAELPEKAGIDPFHLLIDRTPDDNTKQVDTQ